MLFNRYANWGLAKKQPSLESVLATKQLSEEEILKAQEFLFENFKAFNPEDYVLVKANWVNYYQGDGLEILKVAHVRFQKGISDLNLLGEHVSFLLDLHQSQLLGFTHMEVNNTKKTYVTHQVALNTAIQFLKRYAPDLIPENTEFITIGHKRDGSKMTFKETLNLGNIEVHWIGSHDEEIRGQGKKKKISGMKVKMYIPFNQLWVWVVVDDQAHVQTFERNVFWNFKAFQRETQMWLHDHWLAEHKLLSENKK